MRRLAFFSYYSAVLKNYSVFLTAPVLIGLFGNCINEQDITVADGLHFDKPKLN